MIYLDYASTTPVDPRVAQAMLPYFTDKFENSSSIYSGGLEVKQAVEKSRDKIAKFLNCDSSEVIFTSGGTESDNLAIFGVAENYDKGHIVTSEIEHPAVYEACRKLEKNGFEITYLKPGIEGIISPEQVRKALRNDTILVSIMYANNEIGTVQPIAEIASVIRNFKNSKAKTLNSKQIPNSKNINSKKISNLEYRVSDFSEKTPFFHSDACQGALYLEMDVQNLGVDLLTFNGSKIYAPKGIGVLYKRDAVKLLPQIVGGEQENGLRAGTENVPYIVALAKAVGLISQKEVLREKKIRDYLFAALSKISSVSINGSLKHRLPNNVNFSIKGVEGESVLLDLDHSGIAVSTGSACSSRDLNPSRVITAISDEKIAHESIRVSIGRFTSRKEIDIFLKHLKETIKRFQEMSPYVRS